MLKKLEILLYTILLSPLVNSTCVAKNHALIIGIGNYPFQPLEGPKYDALAMQDVLTTQWRFDKYNVTLLLNEDATRDNILDSLDHLYINSQYGDNIFIYYSGHGTSLHDKTIRVPLPNYSGALIPYDIRGLQSREELMTKLIKGRDDLRPRLSKLDDNGRHVFIAIDACYSGNAVRALNGIDSLPTRFMNISSLIKNSTNESTLNDIDPSTSTSMIMDNDESLYPYKNTYFLSAASEHEKAQDIPTRFLKTIPTIDGKPHGAFTNSLLEKLHKPDLADLNKDNSISYSELTLALTKRMQERGFNHIPSSLPKDKSNQLQQKTVFFINSERGPINQNKQESAIRLKNLGFK